MFCVIYCIKYQPSIEYKCIFIFQDGVGKRMLVFTVIRLFYEKVSSIPSSALFKLGARLVVPLGQPINTVIAENTNYRSLQCADLNDNVKDKGIPYYNKGEKKN